MKKIIVMGSSLETLKTIEGIRSADTESEIVLFSRDGHYPYNRELFASLITKEITRQQIFYQPKDFYAKHNIQVIVDKEITRISLKKRKVLTEDKSQFDFDLLFVTQAPDYRFPDMKGNNSTGVYGLKKLKSIEQIIKNLPFVETIIIQACQENDFKIAASLVKREKEIVVLLREKSLDEIILSVETKEQILNLIAENKINIIYENEMVEILGEAEVKAVRLKSGKVLATQMILFGDTKEDLRLFLDSPLHMNEKICVDEQSKTNIDFVFAFGDACEVNMMATQRVSAF